MGVMNRTIAGGLIFAMLLALQGIALAGDSDRKSENETDSVRTHETDGVRGERVTDRVQTLVTDRPNKRVTDRPRDTVTGHKTDVVMDLPSDRRVTDRCHLVTNDHVRRLCKPDKPTDVNIRHLIHRLVHAGEWAKLIRLLHRLGWI